MNSEEFEEQFEEEGATQETAQRVLTVEERKIAEIVSMVLESTPAMGMGSLMMSHTGAQGRIADAGVTQQWQHSQVGLATTTQCVATILDLRPRRLRREIDEMISGE
jgi:hypothetical protein